MKEGRTGHFAGQDAERCVRSVGATDLPTKETNTACTHTQTNTGKEKRAVHLPEIKQIFSKILGKCVGRTSNVGELLQRVHTHCAAEGWAGQYIQEKIKKPTKRRWITRYLALHAANRMGEEEEEERIAAGAIKIDTSTTALKPYIPDWQLAAWRQLQVKGAFRKGWDRSRLLEAYDEGKARLVFELAVEKNEKGSLWTGTKVVGGGEGEGGWSERIPAALEKKQVTKKTMNKETGEEEIEEMLVDLEEPEESETDIAERLGEVEREARFAEEVRCVGCCWMGTYNVVLYQAIDFPHTNKNTKHTDRAAAG